MAAFRAEKLSQTTLPQTATLAPEASQSPLGLHNKMPKVYLNKHVLKNGSEFLNLTLVEMLLRLRVMHD